MGFPFTFYQLKGDGLLSGIRIHEREDQNNPGRSMPLDNKVVALAGFTVGLELQFLSFMSFEMNIQGAWESLNNKNFMNFTAGAELKLPLKPVRNVVLEPYGAFISALLF